MRYIERNALIDQGELQAKCKVALCDWANYWAINGTSEIQPQELREKTEHFIMLLLDNANEYAEKVALLLIGSPAYQEAEEPLDDEAIKSGINTILANALDFLIG